jgi:hypothetical protein
MDKRVEDELAVAARPADGPAGKAAGDLVDIFLCVTAIDPEGVQSVPMAHSTPSRSAISIGVVVP